MTIDSTGLRICLTRVFVLKHKKKSIEQKYISKNANSPSALVVI